MPQRNLLRNAGLLCNPFCQIEHGWRCIQQSDMNSKPRQTHRERTCTAPEIQSLQRLCGLRENLLEVGKGEIDTESALRRLQVGSVLFCLPLKPLSVGVVGHN